MARPRAAFPDPQRGAIPIRAGRCAPDPEEPELLHLRLLPPRSYRQRHRPPEWEVTDDSGHVVGWIEERHFPTADRPFYDLAGVHPVTGERIELQLSADLDERLAKLEEFLVDPDSCAQHFTTGTRARVEWDARRSARPSELGTGKGGRHG